MSDRIESIKIYIDSESAMPARSYENDAGLDLRAVGDYCLWVGCTKEIDTGVHFEIPRGFFGQVSIRSSFTRRDIFIPGGIGVIDSDYRGSVKVPLRNFGVRKEWIYDGDRIAQIIFIPCSTPKLEVVTSLDMLTSTPRGNGGFGSTGR